MKPLTIEPALRMIGGFFILLSLALGWWVSPYFFLFTAFVGLNLFQSGITDWCPMFWILERVGLKRCADAPRRTA